MAAFGLLLVVPAFWSGLPILLGSGGRAARARRQARTRRCRPVDRGLVLGLLAVVAYLAFYLLDYLHTHGIGSTTKDASSRRQPVRRDAHTRRRTAVTLPRMVAWVPSIGS